jgi:hypothetical protein
MSISLSATGVLLAAPNSHFVKDPSMVAEPPANYLLWYWVEMPRTGPLWVTLGEGLTSHALVLVGIYESSTDESQKSYDDAIFECGYLYEPALGFMQRVEREASVIVLNGAANVDLRSQIIHWASNPLQASGESPKSLPMSTQK